MKSRRTKIRTYFIFLKELQGFFFSKFSSAQRKTLKYFYTVAISQIQLPQSYWKSRASKQTTPLTV
jgi:hypothetical protein